MTQERSLTLLVCALGGEGGGVLTDWLVEAARLAGYPVQATSIPGVAQRTGATTYYLEVFPVPQAQLAGRRPVFSLSPVPGEVDALVSSELLETARQAGNGMAAPHRTLVLSSTARLLTTHERMQLADGRVEADQLLRVVQACSREHVVFDMNAVAREAGTVVSAVMLGAIAGSGLLPMRREHYEEAVRGGKGAEASLRGFARAHDLVQQQRRQAQFVEQVLAPAPAAAEVPGPAQVPGLQDMPPAVREVYALGYARALDYQGRRYAQLYAQRLQAVLAAENEADPTGSHGHAITRETARWLALWMAFDDIVRVADLKSRASRLQRVRGEVRAADADLLKVWDHFKPGMPEFAALLPAGLAARVLAWDRRRVAAGREPWALPLQVGTHGVGGMLALRTLASLKWLRVRGSRYAAEQQMIERWLQAVADGARRGWALGHEVALCGRLIKGYGATNERGKENLLHVLQHVAGGGEAAATARAVAAVREAALADDAGRAFDAALVQHGAPPRTIQPQPIRFVRRPKEAGARQAA